MKISTFNWQIWAGFLLSFFALASYPLIFVEWPLTRDFPWANILLFVAALILVLVGLRRGFGTDRGWFSKIGASALAALTYFYSPDLSWSRLWLQNGFQRLPERRKSDKKHPGLLLPIHPGNR